MVELDGDEMTRIIWKKIREEVSTPSYSAARVAWPQTEDEDTSWGVLFSAAIAVALRSVSKAPVNSQGYARAYYCESPLILNCLHSSSCHT